MRYFHYNKAEKPECDSEMFQICTLRAHKSQKRPCRCFFFGGGLQWAGVSHRSTVQFFILSLLLFDREICGSWQVPRTFEHGYSFMSSGSRVLWRECKQKGQLTRLRAFKPTQNVFVFWATCGHQTQAVNTLKDSLELISGIWYERVAYLHIQKIHVTIDSELELCAWPSVLVLLNIALHLLPKITH